MFSVLLFLTNLIVLSTADGYTCAGYLINPPEDLTYYFPEDWREDMVPAKYAGSQTCNWQINVLEGYYATVTFYKNTDMESGITCTYPNGQEQYIEDKEHNPYIFTYPQFQVNLHVSDKQGEFSFKVVWSKYPATCKMNMELTDAGALSAVPNECVNTYTSPNKVMLIGFTLKDDLDVLLRQSAVFEGDSVNGEYLGNLYYARYRQIVSPSNKLTVYTWWLNQNINYTLFMGMDTRAVGDVQQITGLNCPSDPINKCYITLNSNYNISAIATIGRQPDFLEPIMQFPSESTLKIYEEQINDNHLVAKIDKSNYQTRFPMAVKNSLKIYHLDKGRVSIPLTNSENEAKYDTVYDGRYVNVHSFDYGRTSYQQDTSQTFQTQPNKKLYFQFNVKYFDINGNTTLDIKVSRDGKLVYSDTFSQTNLPPANTLKVFGDQMAINYQTYGNYTMGFEVDLLTTKNDDDSSSPTTPSPSVTSSTIVTPAKTVTLSTSSPPANPKTTVTSNTLELSTLTDIPTTGSTTPGGITRGTTQRYETSTKSGTTQFTFVSVLLIIISSVL